MIKFSRFSISGLILGTLLMATPTWAMEMPDDILESVFSKLPVRTLASIAPVSKQWQKVSENDRVWTIHGFSSKKKCVEFPFLTLEHKHLVALFKDNYVSGNSVFFWKLVEKVETPGEIMKQCTPTVPYTSIQWTASNTMCKIQAPNLIHCTTELIFWSEVMKARMTYKNLPYTLILKGSWVVENINSSPVIRF